MNRVLATMSLVFSLITGSALADGFGINVTRIIFNGNRNNATVTVRNTSAQDIYIVQARISKTVDGYESTPFVITPPIFRLDSESTNNLRIQLSSASNLSQDRESVFYLNTRAIPSSVRKNVNNDTDHISGTAQFGVGNIIKLFYRPAGLSGSVENAQRAISFIPEGKGIRVKNNSAYYISFARMTIAGESLLKQNAPTMLAPYSDYVYSVGTKHGKVAWATINDFGGLNEHTANL